MLRAGAWRALSGLRASGGRWRRPRQQGCARGWVRARVRKSLGSVLGLPLIV